MWRWDNNTSGLISVIVCVVKEIILLHDMEYFFPWHLRLCRVRISFFLAGDVLMANSHQLISSFSLWALCKFPYTHLSWLQWTVGKIETTDGLIIFQKGVIDNFQKLQVLSRIFWGVMHLTCIDTCMVFVTGSRNGFRSHWSPPYTPNYLASAYYMVSGNTEPLAPKLAHAGSQIGFSRLTFREPWKQLFPTTFWNFWNCSGRNHVSTVAKDVLCHKSHRNMGFL